MGFGIWDLGFGVWVVGFRDISGVTRQIRVLRVIGNIRVMRVQHDGRRLLGRSGFWNPRTTLCPSY